MHNRTTYNKGCRCEECVAANIAYQQEYYRKNRDKVAARHKEYGVQYRIKTNDRKKDYDRQYYRQNIDKDRLKQNRRRVLRANAEGSHTVEQFNELKETYGNRCLRCGIHETAVGTLHRDHIVPLSKGGSDYIDNIQPLCAKCNLRKGDRDQTDYRIA